MMHYRVNCVYYLQYLLAMLSHRYIDIDILCNIHLLVVINSSSLALIASYRVLKPLNGQFSVIILAILNASRTSCKFYYLHNGSQSGITFSQEQCNTSCSSVLTYCSNNKTNQADLFLNSHVFHITYHSHHHHHH